MKTLTHIFCSIYYTFLSVCWSVIIKFSIHTPLNEIFKIVNSDIITLKNLFWLCINAFHILFMITVFIVSVLRTLYELYFIFRYTFFPSYYKYDNMTIIINEKNEIEKSYITFENGDTIPVHIKRISLKLENTGKEKEESHE